MGFGEVKIKVDGVPVRFDVDEQLEIADVSKDMDQVAAQQAYWGSVWASAEGEKIAADAFYRTWRAERGEAILTKDPKIAEWKMKQKVESDPKFAKIKKGLARAARNVILTRAIHDAFASKANMLQSKGAMMRSELDSTGMHTKGSDSGDKRAANKAAMKKIFKKKKR